MILRDRLWISLRHMRTGIIGVILVVLATAIGVALAAATMAFIRNYNEQTKRMLNHPVYREVVIEVLGITESELSAPVVEYVNDLSRRESLLGLDDISLVLQTVPAVKYAYLATPAEFNSTSYLMELYPESINRVQRATESGDEKEQQREVEENKEETESKETAEEKPGTENERSGRERRATEEKSDPEMKEESGEELRRFLKELQEIEEMPINSFRGVYVTTDFFQAYGLTIAQGSLINQNDLESGNQVIVLGSTLSETLFPQGNAIGSRISVNFQTYTIIGILEQNSIVVPDSLTEFNDIAFAPHYSLAGTVYGKDVGSNKNAISTIHYSVEDSADIQQAVFQLQEYFDTEHPGSNYRISASVEKTKSERQKQQIILVVLVFLTIAGLFIAAINLFNLMLIRIIKHTKGIGIMIALGSTGRDIFRQFMNESLLMSLAGAVIGIVISPFVFNFLQSTIISNVGAASRAFLPDLLLGAAAALVFSLLFGVYPAYIAGKTDAASAIKSE